MKSFVRVILSMLPGLLGMVLLLPSAPAVAQSASLGRVFYSPQQRQDMDRRRASNVASVAVTPDDIVTVNGRVARSSGKNTTWINGIAQDDAHPGPDAGRVMLRQSEEGPLLPLKTGETLDRVKMETRSNIGDGKITVRRSAR